jgi:SAM-dependent methyltransferase
MTGTQVNNGETSEPLYLTYAQPELHPSRIGAVAALSGFPAVPSSKCSYLELGCGNGGNLIPLAESYPSATFVGVDLDSRAIELAIARVATLGISNVRFIHSDLLTFDPSQSGTGTFDYIVCHGLYSWVPEAVQHRVFEVISSGLSENGLGYVSYNVIPGWRQRGVLRDIMRFGVSLGKETLGKPEAEVLPPEERLKAGAQFLTFVSSVRQSSEDLYGTYLKEAISRLQHADLPYLVNEYLGEYNEPVSFLQFMEKAKKANLQYVGEARPALMFTEDLGERVDGFLKRGAPSLLYREQLLDFCRNRMFRETILARAGTCNPALVPELTRLPALYVSSEYTPVLPLAQMKHRAEVPFVNAITAREITVDGGDDAVVLALIGETPSGGLSLEALQQARKEAGLEDALDSRVREVLVRLLKLGALDIWLEPLSVMRDIAAKATLTTFSLEMVRIAHVEGGGSVTTATHRTLPLTDKECEVLLHFSAGKTLSEVANTPEIKVGFPEEGELESLLLSLYRRGLFREKSK